MGTVFSKIHGLGNDFVVINELQREAIKKKSEFAKKYCCVHTGIGADGVLFLCKSKVADFKMSIFNADGSEAENCVNGLRCVALQKFLLDGKKKKNYSIETLAGLVNAKIVSFKNNIAQVDIEFLGKKQFLGKFFVEVDGKAFEYYSVNVGNPHAVVFLKDSVENFDVEGIGHKISYHKQFEPAYTNTEFVNLVSPTKVKMRVHERGACETQACGSGSIAIVIAGIRAGILEEKKWVSVSQPGGTIEINFDGKEKLLLRGAAEIVFTGRLED
jgi:diaminopimelate epimerase